MNSEHVFFERGDFNKHTTAFTTTHHAFASHEILTNIPTPKPVIYKRKALHLHLGGTKGLQAANGVFERLSEVGGESVAHRKLTKDELVKRGYDPKFVVQV